MKNEISLCMIVKNEEEYLENCLNSIKDVVDEIIVVDTGSTDKTVEIAKSFGAKVYYFQWNNNFSEARNESLKYATKDWILIMDADDELCQEDKGNFKVLLNQLDENSVYFFQTLSYYGNSVDNNNITINLNPRLFKNNRGIYYAGEIHNQLIFKHNECNAICNTIKIYHYGYLGKRIQSKDKRSRNISILNEQIKKNPNSKFAYFNLGCEYSASGDMKKALECYYKAYEDFDPTKGYGFILLIRIINSNYDIGEYNEALKFIDIGIKYYPKCTDLYFYKAAIFNVLNRPTLQIRALEKCIELGEAPSELKYLYGTGSFRAYYELGNVYMRFKDYDAAYKYYIEAMKCKLDYLDPLYNIAHILKEQNLPLDEFKAIIEKFFSDYPKSYSIIADLFYNEGYYKVALEYIEKCEQLGITGENIQVLKTKCFVRIGKFEECINMKEINEEKSSYFYFSMYRVLSSVILNKYDYAASIIQNFKEEDLSEFNKKVLKVYSQMINLFNNEQTVMISEEENEKEYMSIILEICEILLANEKFNELSIAVNLFNLVENKYALLYLGKLYYKYGYIDIGKNEILRSIKEFDIYDAEGLDMLKI